MSFVDITVVVTVIIMALLGIRKGFAWQFVQIASIVGGVLLASAVSARVARLFGYRSPGACWVVAAILFVLVTLAGHLLAVRLRTRLDEWELKSWDKELGAVIGALKGLVLCAVILAFLLMPRTGLRKTVLEKSLVGKPLAHALEGMRRYIPTDLHQEVHRKVHGLIISVPVGPHWQTVEDD